MEFSSEDSSSSTQESKPKTLETLLLEKNRTLQNENTTLKLTNNDVTGKGPITISLGIFFFFKLKNLTTAQLTLCVYIYTCIELELFFPVCFKP